MENNDDFFNPNNAVKSQRVTFGKIGDYIKGVLTDIKTIDDQFKPGEKVNIYEILTHVGSFHELDENKAPKEPAIAIEKGEYRNVFGKKSIDDQMRKIVVGQIVGLKFTEQKPSKQKGFNPVKIVKVFPGGMDAEYQGQSANDSQPL